MAPATRVTSMSTGPGRVAAPPQVSAGVDCSRSTTAVVTASGPPTTTTLVMPSSAIAPSAAGDREAGGVSRVPVPRSRARYALASASGYAASVASTTGRVPVVPGHWPVAAGNWCSSSAAAVASAVAPKMRVVPGPTTRNVDAFDGALVPSVVVTVTSTTPGGSAGVVTVIAPLELLVTVAGYVPKSTASSSVGTRYVPWMVTLVPPLELPCDGVSDVTVGSGVP